MITCGAPPKTSGFSRKVYNHWRSLQLHFFGYHFVNIHRSIRMTPAMKAGVYDGLLDVEDLAQMLEDREAVERRALRHFENATASN